ncbi:MAG: hypothetical protein ACFFD4_02795 [Candidatus Odinarchaeota archaeon]
MRRIFPVFIISTILFFAMNSATIDTVALPTLTSQNADISVLQPDMWVKEPGSQEYVEPEKLVTATTIPPIKNSSDLRFQASVSNFGSEYIQLKSFKVSLFNETGEVQVFEKIYPEETLAQEKLSSRETITDRVEGTVRFTDTESTYHFMFTFAYVRASNLSKILEVHNSKGNITVTVFSPSQAPPFFILWGIGFFSSMLLLMCALGYYGNRKKRIAESEAAKK